MEAEQQEFMSIKKALQEMGETGTTNEQEIERLIGQESAQPRMVPVEVSEVNDAEAEIER
jgi:hypothetical protein